MTTFRSVLFAFLFCFISTTCFAQINQHDFLIGGTAKFNRHNSDNSKSSQATFSPKFGYFPLKWLAIGTETRYSLFNSNHYISSSSGVFQFLRLYGELNDKSYLFGTVNYGVVTSSSTFKNSNSSQYTSNTSEIGCELGFSHFIKPAIGLEVLATYSYGKRRDQTFVADIVKFSEFGFELGFQIYL